MRHEPLPERVQSQETEAPPFVDLIDDEELSRRTGISANTWRKYRLEGRSPPYLKVGIRWQSQRM